MRLYSTFVCLVTFTFTVQSLPIFQGTGGVGLEKRTLKTSGGGTSSGELIGPPSPTSDETRDICKVEHEGKEVTIRGHLAKGGSQKQAWVVTSAPGFPTNMHYFAKTGLTPTEFKATVDMALVIAHSKKEDCAMMHFLGEDITSLKSYEKAFGEGVEACEKWVDEKFNLVEVQIDGMRARLGEGARHRDLHPWNTRWLSETTLKIIDFGMLHRNGGEDVDKAMRKEWKKMLCKGAAHGAKPSKGLLHSSGISDADFVHVSSRTSSFEIVKHGSH
ncbi:hypothetical protein FRC17_000871 [Serendipita sp. 399]|nr:hypothetical protein FRC17_000871 [Serendipita sp. 399]